MPDLNRASEITTDKSSMSLDDFMERRIRISERWLANQTITHKGKY